MNQIAPQTLVLIYIFAFVTRWPRLKERWPAPLVRGPEWFFGISVAPDFLAGPGRTILRRYRMLLLVPWAIEIPALAAILFAGNRIGVLWLIVGIALFTRANFYMARQWAENQARRFETPGASESGTAVSLSLQPRRLITYTNPWIEAVIALASVGSFAWLGLHRVPAPLFATAVFNLYLQGGLLLMKRAIVRARTVVPVENPEQYLAWRDSLRRFSTRTCDMGRLFLSFIPLTAVISSWQSVALQPTLRFFVLAATLVASWYEYRGRRQYLEVARRTRPATLIGRPDIHETGKLICFLPSHPALLLRSLNGYALNLAGVPARVAGLYLAGFAGLCTWLLR